MCTQASKTFLLASHSDTFQLCVSAMITLSVLVVSLIRVPLCLVSDSLCTAPLWSPLPPTAISCISESVLAALHHYGLADAFAGRQENGLARPNAYSGSARSRRRRCVGVDLGCECFCCKFVVWYNSDDICRVGFPAPL